MVKYSYIPPEYKTPSNMSSTTSSKASLLHRSVSNPIKEPHIPYRDTGAAGKYIFGRPPSWTYKPLPPIPSEAVEDTPSKPLVSKPREADYDAVSEKTETSVQEGQFVEIKKQGKFAKVAKNFSKRFSITTSK